MTISLQTKKSYIFTNQSTSKKYFEKIANTDFEKREGTGEKGWLNASKCRVTQEITFHTALELNKRIQLVIKKCLKCDQKKSEEKSKSINEIKDEILTKTLSLIDKIQRDMNAGKVSEDYKSEFSFLNNTEDPSLGQDFVETVKTLATHRNHYIGKTTKINWFGRTNKTESIEKFKKLLQQNPAFHVEDYPDTFFTAAKVQDLPERHYKEDLKCAMSILISDGIYGTEAPCSLGRSKGKYEKHTDDDKKQKDKSVRFGCCSVTLYKTGKLEIQFFRPTYHIGIDSKKEEEDSKNKIELFYSKTYDSYTSWKEYEKKLAQAGTMPTSVSSTSLPSAGSASSATGA